MFRLFRDIHMEKQVLRGAFVELKLLWTVLRLQ